MYGVVLWSDRNRKSAVIWCEDHRNLAFIREDASSARLQPGDLVEFDLHEENDIRLALGPRLVAPEQYPSLADALKSTARRAMR